MARDSGNHLVRVITKFLRYNAPFIHRALGSEWQTITIYNVSTIREQCPHSYLTTLNHVIQDQ
ncbi:hypothetical protein D3C76_1741320 [compost metagenome]